MSNDGARRARLTVAFDPEVRDRAAFSSGVDAVDNFLRKTANKLSRADNLRTFVLATDDGNVIGYYSLNASEIDYAELPARYARTRPRHGVIPASFIAMIGVDQAYQGRGVGTALLVDCIARIGDAADLMGIAVVLLDVLDDGDPAALARRTRLYEEFGFRSLERNPSRLYLSLANVRAAIERQGYH